MAAEAGEAIEAVQAMEAVAVRPLRLLWPQRLLRPWRPKIKKSHFEVEFQNAHSSGRSKVVEAIEAVVKVAEVVEATEATEATDLNIKRPCIKESRFKRMSQIRFFRERSEPRLSQEQTSKGVLN